MIKLLNSIPIEKSKCSKTCLQLPVCTVLYSGRDSLNSSYFVPFQVQLDICYVYNYCPNKVSYIILLNPFSV